MSYHFFAMFLGFVLDLLFGDPHWLPHPIRLIGNLIASLEKLNKKELSDTKKFLRGFAMVVIVIAWTTGVTAVILEGAYGLHPAIGCAVEAIMTYQILATKFPLLKAMGLMINANKKSGMARIAKMMHKDAAWLEAHPQYKAYSWDFHFDETKHQDGFYYHFTQCPLNTFARKEGYLEVLPIMCDIDYKTAALMHAKLYRDHTLAGSGEVCDYWFVGDKVENPK